MKRSHFFLLLALFAISVAVLAPALASAETELIAPIPGAESNAGESLKTYLTAVFKYGLGLAALIALAQLVFGAVQYTTSAGAPSLQEDAKSRMRSAIVGVILLVSAGLIWTLIANKNTPAPQSVVEDARRRREEEHPKVVNEMKDNHQSLGENDLGKLAYSVDVIRTNKDRLVPWVEAPNDGLAAQAYEERLTAALLDSSKSIESKIGLMNELNKGIQTDSRYEVFDTTLKYKIPIAIYRVSLLKAKDGLSSSDWRALYDGLKTNGSYNAYGIGPDKD